MLCFSWDMARDKCNCYFSFWVIFCTLPPPPTSSKNQNLKKNEKKPGDIIIYVYQKLWSDDIRFLTYSAQRTDRWTDSQTDEQTARQMDGKSDVYRWVPHLKNVLLWQWRNYKMIFIFSLTSFVVFFKLLFACSTALAHYKLDSLTQPMLITML